METEITFCNHHTFSIGGRDGSVCIATRYGFDGPGIDSRWETKFSAPVQTGPGELPSLMYNGYRVFPWVKRLGRGADPPPPTLSAEVLNRVELYLYPP